MRTTPTWTLPDHSPSVMSRRWVPKLIYLGRVRRRRGGVRVGRAWISPFSLWTRCYRTWLLARPSALSPGAAGSKRSQNVLPLPWKNKNKNHTFISSDSKHSQNVLPLPWKNKNKKSHFYQQWFKALTHWFYVNELFDCQLKSNTKCNKLNSKVLRPKKSVCFR